MMHAILNIVAVSLLLLFRVSGEEAGAPPAPLDAGKGSVGSSGAKLKGSEIQFEKLANGGLKLGNLTVHPETREISFPARIILAHGILEAVVVTPTGRLHEALLLADVKPLQLQALLYLLDYKNGPRLPDSTGRRGDLLDIDVCWMDPGRGECRETVEEWILDTRTQTPSKRLGWVFVGSPIRDGQFLADVEGNVIVNYSVGATVLDTSEPASTDDTLFTVNEDKNRPGKDAEVRVILKPYRP